MKIYLNEIFSNLYLCADLLFVSPVGKVLDFLSHICNQLVLAFAFREQNVLRVVVVFLQHIFKVYNINMTIKLFKYICFKCKAVDSSISQSLGFYICSFVDCMETQTSLGLDSTDIPKKH